jgi:hypothetical protein
MRQYHTAPMPLSALTMPLSDLRSQLLDGLPWSPLDFLKGISRDGDRAVQFGGLLREMDVANDLRFTYPIATDADVAVFAERLPWDSAFFGYEVARLNGVFPLAGYRGEADYTPALRALVEVARSRGVRYLLATVDARDLPTFRALTALGFTLIETRLYHACALRSWKYSRRSRCRLATAADVERLVAMSYTNENPYDRFNSDPFIGRDEAHRLIAEWIRASIVDGFADGTMIPDSPDPGALCTFKYHRDKAAAWGMSIGQLVLGVAAPRMHNRFLGVVADINFHLQALGFDYVIFVTQITNRNSQRVGAHLGYEYGGRGEYVFRMLL